MTEQNSATAGNEPQPTQVPGVILRTDDGTHYFIPDRALATFQVTSSMGKAAVQDKLAAIHSGQESASQIEAYHVNVPNTTFGHTEVFS